MPFYAVGGREISWAPAENEKLSRKFEERDLIPWNSLVHILLLKINQACGHT